ncbi:DUF4199 domain-containing protein [Puteibacter caeruleilacunae]|nr:DUF4199 domain-containing protein [Puteibacter caeruleilacunae]
MNSPKNTFTSSAMTYGLIMGGGLLLVNLMFWMMDDPFNERSGLLNYVIVIGGIVFGSIQYRKTLSDGYFPYGRALGYGVATSFYASFVMAIWTILLYKVVDPSMVEKLRIMTEEQMLNIGYSEDMVEQQMNLTGKLMTSPVFLSIMQIFSVTLMGFICSLVIAAFTRIKSTGGFDAAMKEIENDVKSKDE